MSSSVPQICRVCWAPNPFLTLYCGHPFCLECISTFYSTFFADRPQLKEDGGQIWCPYCKGNLLISAKVDKKEGQWTLYQLAIDESSGTPFDDHANQNVMSVRTDWLRQRKSRPGHQPVTLTVVVNNRLDWPIIGWNTNVDTKTGEVSHFELPRVAFEGITATPQVQSTSGWRLYETSKLSSGPLREAMDEDGMPWTVTTFLDISASESESATWILAQIDLEQKLRHCLLEAWCQVMVPSGAVLPPPDHPIWKKLGSCRHCSECYACQWFEAGAGEEVTWEYRQAANDDDAERAAERAAQEVFEDENSNAEDPVGDDEASEWESDWLSEENGRNSENSNDGHSNHEDSDHEESRRGESDHGDFDHEECRHEKSDHKDSDSEGSDHEDSIHEAPDRGQWNSHNENGDHEDSDGEDSHHEDDDLEESADDDSDYEDSNREDSDDEDSDDSGSNDGGFYNGGSNDNFNYDDSSDDSDVDEEMPDADAPRTRYGCELPTPRRLVPETSDAPSETSGLHEADNEGDVIMTFNNGVTVGGDGNRITASSEIRIRTAVNAAVEQVLQANGDDVRGRTTNVTVNGGLTITGNGNVVNMR